MSDNHHVLTGNSLEVLKDFPDNSIDSVVTDPPYGLKFMGKKWDYDVPSVELWKEVLRVLKPGGHLLSFGGTRTYHRMVINIEDAGFEIRDQIQWLYGSGFPKSHNIKEGEFKGYGTALKPANEPICLARKPLEGTVVQNLAAYGVGGLNIDASRIGSEVRQNAQKSMDIDNQGFGGIARGAVGVKQKTSGYKEVTGRWPANLILDETAAEMLDEQSGVSKSAKLNTIQQPRNDLKAKGAERLRIREDEGYSDSGGASRFFYVAKVSKRERNAGLEGMPEKRSDYRPGDDETKNTIREHLHNSVGKLNHHPTVKPIKLMEYLIKLITPPGGIVLDPFMGSGSTGVAAKNLGFEFIGIELSEDYAEIARKRIGK
jgi:DNA modification methylase